MSIRIVRTLVTVVFFVTAGDATANEPRAHDGGVFLRLSAGGGGARTKIEDASDKLEMDGGVGEYNFAIGGIVTPNLAVHATIFGWGVSGPTVTFNDENLGSAGFDLGLSAFGGGLTYFFSPVNLYLSGSAGFSRLRVDGPIVDGGSDTGLAIDLTGGKEWWSAIAGRSDSLWGSATTTFRRTT